MAIVAMTATTAAAIRTATKAKARELPSEVGRPVPTAIVA
jgi:hypothetical protein